MHDTQTHCRSVTKLIRGNCKGSTYLLYALHILKKPFFVSLSSEGAVRVFTPHPATFTVDVPVTSVMLWPSWGHSTTVMNPLLLPPMFIYHLTQHICEWAPTTTAGRKSRKQWMKVCKMCHRTSVCGLMIDAGVKAIMVDTLKTSVFRLSQLNVPLMLNCNNSFHPLAFAATLVKTQK